MHAASFKLGTFSIRERPQYPALILDPAAEGDDVSAQPQGARIVPLHHLTPLLRATGTVLCGADSLLSLLEHWPQNLPALTRLCTDAYPEVLRLSFPEIEARTHAPISAPRQIFCTVANDRRQVTESVMDAGAPPHTDGMSLEQRRDYAAKLIEARVTSPPYVCL